MTAPNAKASRASAADGLDRLPEAGWRRLLRPASLALLAAIAIAAAGLFFLGADLVLWCSANGHAATLRVLLKLNQSWANGRPADLMLGGQGPVGAPMSPISATAGGGHYAAAEALFAAGADPMPDDGLDTPLTLAVRRGDKAMAKLLMDHGAWPLARDINFVADLEFLRIIAPPGVAKRSAGALRELGLATVVLSGPLGKAPTRSMIDRLEVLAEARGDGGGGGQFGVLIAAALDHGDDGAAMELLDLAKRYRWGIDSWPLIYAQTPRGIQGLIDLGAELNPAEANGESFALVLASQYGPEDQVLALLDAGANPRSKRGGPPGVADPEFGSVLHFAAKRGFERAARRLVDLGADPAALDGAGKTPAEVAATDEIREFLEWAAKR